MKSLIIASIFFSLASMLLTNSYFLERFYNQMFKNMIKHEYYQKLIEIYQSSDSEMYVE
jgi:hypothetical protein